MYEPPQAVAPDARSLQAGEAFDIETYGELMPSLRREWLLTNGLGGYASGTVADVNTRRYHGTLVAATSPPVGRIVAVSRWAATLVVDGQRFELWGGNFRTGLAGEGPGLLRRFALRDDVARWTFEAAGGEIQKEIFVAWRRNASATTFRLSAELCREGVSLELTPFLALRGFHNLQNTGHAHFDVRAEEADVLVKHRDMAVWLAPASTDDGEATFERSPDWWYAHTYPMETARGLDDREDLFTPGRFTFKPADTGGDAAITVWANLDERPTLDLEAEKARRAEQPVPAIAPSIAQRRLQRAARDFVVQRPRPDGMPGTTVIAGYPWSSDWGRATFISLPGLLLSTGRHHVAGQVLVTFAHYLSEGMLPSRFDESGNEPAYATADASLWFVHAAFAYLRATRDQDTFDAVIRPACEQVVEAFDAGTRFNIGVDPADGLVQAGDDSVALTWMDAVADDRPVTPRNGKAVEINALWYNALQLLGYSDRAATVAASYCDAFRLKNGRGLADVVQGGPDDYDRDERVRPNQVFAVSLRHSPLPEDAQREVVDVLRNRLLSPYGLRTLDPSDPLYRSRYTGTPRERALARHNGVVWPWLIGPFLDAHLRVHGRNAESVRRARKWLSPLLAGVESHGCVGSLGEMLDPEFPHRPGGCFAQAWSVAEVLRLATDLDL